MKAHKLNARNLLSTIIIVSLIIVGASFYFDGIYTLDQIVNKTIKNTTPALILGLLYFYFDRFGWRHKFWKDIRLSELFEFPPDLRGRWYGKLYREQDGVEHDFVVEIQQTMTEISLNTYSPTGNQSSSIIEQITIARDNAKIYGLCYLWDGTGSKIETELSRSGRFHGYTILKLSENNNKLKGNYFTDRNTRGTLSLSWQGLDLKNDF